MSEPLDLNQLAQKIKQWGLELIEIEGL